MRVNRIVYRGALVLKIALTGLLVVGTNALAQMGVGVSPPRTEQNAQPGSEITQTISIDNPDPAHHIDVQAYFEDALLAPDGSVIYITAGSHPLSLSEWASVSPIEFGLGPSSSQDVNYTIRVPSDAKPATYWSILFFESEPPAAADEPQGFSIATVIRVGHIIYVTVGHPTLEGNIANISFDAAGRPGAVRITFQNSGDGLMRLNGHVEVRSTVGELLQVLSLDDVASFPGATHDLVLPLTEPLPSGEYVVLAVLDYGEASVIAGEGQVVVP